MRRETQNVLLLLLGGALLKIAVTGDYLRYVKPTHQPWLVGAGIVMLVLAGVAIVRDVRDGARAAAGDTDETDDAGDGRGCAPDACAGEGGHEHTARSAWLIVVPVLAVLLVAPPALGADSVLRTRQNTEPGNTEFAPLPPREVVSLPVGDFVARAGWDERDSLDGRTVRLTGFVVQTADGPQLARMTMSCCAADAFAVRTGLTGGQADLLPSDTWVEVTGHLVPADDTRARDYVPDLAVRTLREIPRPEEPYET
ncbi:MULTISPECIES: TIGR03943 family putative permease subunit [Prauserella salsuginis group]|uniref:TIGR03943 family putative permease subunit n=1 Tax=Prauserella salsuginis TaxID=387889 RepID=A0ABW6G3R8_9PSEU|nr:MULTISPECIES: TIGR03943 family protein [Prauserella salsuginis group]MCR3718688.1 TIGR03943 family protein [Prauserella flava]MCR3733258.1 TIGR03943 family protein [Prauserella salsuginis]